MCSCAVSQDALVTRPLSERYGMHEEDQMNDNPAQLLLRFETGVQGIRACIETAHSTTSYLDRRAVLAEAKERTQALRMWAERRPIPERWVDYLRAIERLLDHDLSSAEMLAGLDESSELKAFDVLTQRLLSSVTGIKLATPPSNDPGSTMIRHYESTRSSGPAELAVFIDPGTAPPEEIAEILSALSILYRRMGGSGINFTPQDVHFLAAVQS